MPARKRSFKWVCSSLWWFESVSEALICINVKQEVTTEGSVGMQSVLKPCKRRSLKYDWWPIQKQHSLRYKYLNGHNVQCKPSPIVSLLHAWIHVGSHMIMMIMCPSIESDKKIQIVKYAFFMTQKCRNRNMNHINMISNSLQTWWNACKWLWTLKNAQVFKITYLSRSSFSSSRAAALLACTAACAACTAFAAATTAPSTRDRTVGVVGLGSSMGWRCLQMIVMIWWSQTTLSYQKKDNDSGGVGGDGRVFRFSFSFVRSFSFSFGSLGSRLSEWGWVRGRGCHCLLFIHCLTVWTVWTLQRWNAGIKRSFSYTVEPCMEWIFVL